MTSGYCYGNVISDSACYASGATVTEWGLPVIVYRPGLSGACAANRLRVSGTSTTLLSTAGMNWLWYARTLGLGYLDASVVAIPTVVT